MSLTRFFRNTLAALSIGLIALLPLPAMADDELPAQIIQVQGNGSITTQPDAFSVQVSVQTEGKTVEAARNSNSQKMNAVIQRLKALNIPNLNLKTAGFYVSPIRESERMPSPRSTKTDNIIAYRVVNQLAVKLENASPEALSTYASQVLDTALAAGANEAGGINFYLSKNNTAQQEALELAIKQARQIADTAAKAAGVRVTGIYNMETQASYMPLQRSYVGAAMAEAKSYAPTPVETGDLEVSASVTVRYIFAQ